MAESAAKPSAQTFFAGQAQVWDARYQSRTYRERRQLIRELVLAEVARRDRRAREIEVLDFGCGGGVLLSDFLEMGLNVTGVDNSGEMIDKARSHIGGDGRGAELERLTSDSGAGNYEQRNYDIVVCASVLEFVPRIEPVVAKLAAVLRAGGMLILSVPNRQSWLRKIEQLVHRHSHAFRHLLPAEVVEKSSYLDIQKHQFTLAELTDAFQRTDLARQKYCFHVAPRLLQRIEDSRSIGMMLTCVFRKGRFTDVSADSPLHTKHR